MHHCAKYPSKHVNKFSIEISCNGFVYKSRFSKSCEMVPVVQKVITAMCSLKQVLKYIWGEFKKRWVRNFKMTETWNIDFIFYLYIILKLQ